MIQSGKPSHLEVRLKVHNPNKLHLKDGTRLDEPLGIEGYLDRIKPATQTKQLVYVATHDGYLFTMSPEHAHSPPPPGLSAGTHSPKELKEAEVCRGAKQILTAHGVMDLRNILAVRRAFHQTPRHTHDDSNNDDEVGVWQELERTESDDEDRGGETGLTAAHDKPRKHMRRSFELLMVTGHVVRLEVCCFSIEYDDPYATLGPFVHCCLGMDPPSPCADNLLEEKASDRRRTRNGPGSPWCRTRTCDTPQACPRCRPKPSP